MNLREKFGAWVLRIIAVAVIALACILLHYLLTRFQVLDTGVSAIVSGLLFLALLVFHRQSEIVYELKQTRKMAGPVTSFMPELEERLASIERRLAGVSQSSQKGLAEMRNLLQASQAEFDKKLAYRAEDEPAADIRLTRNTGNVQSGLPAASTKPLTDATGDAIDDESFISDSPAVLSNDKNMTMHLQPIVNLPDRTPVFFDAFMRLKTRTGGHVDQRQFFKLANDAGLLPDIDRKTIAAATRLLQKLSTLKKPAKVFCRLSAATLEDRAASEEILLHLSQHETLCQNLVIDFDQRTCALMKMPQTKYLTQLKHLGIAFCMSEVLDFKIDAAQLERRGFKYVRIPASILLRTRQEGEGIIAADQLAEVLESHRIDLISNEIEREKDVLGLIDLDVVFAQGPLFAPPRPVKADLVPG